MNQRDDFSQEAIRRLGERVALRCSNPDCRVVTKGPHTSDGKSANIGKACHIHAAAPGGPRYDARQTEAERRSIDNGIWLCSNCSARIDNDDTRYPSDTLRAWKAAAEQTALEHIGRRERPSTDVDPALGVLPPVGRGGKGGIAKVGRGGVAIDGAAGGGVPHWAANGRDGGNVEVADDGFAIGGESEQAGQQDNRDTAYSAVGSFSIHEEKCVAAYRDVLAALAALRSSGEQLERDHDWNQAQHHEMYTATNEAIRKAFDTIERRRVDMTVAFVEAAKSVVEYWDSISTILWDRRYLDDVNPSLDERFDALLRTIPHKYRMRVAPGYFDESNLVR
ncbi:hypothetical protein AB3662_27205 [Sorangium cellulosum]|uniref:hypothetical protein n=1 Tax=Sorangium cellulosum TaxID=56 RepID=UPI003D9A567A